MPSKIKEIQERKRQLVTESEIHRQILALDCEQAAASTLWLEKGYHTYQEFQPALRFVMPATSFALFRRRRARKGPLAKGLLALQLCRRGWKTWRLLRCAIK
jgi:hypothetical protein